MPTAGQTLRDADVCPLMDSHGMGLWVLKLMPGEQNMWADGHCLARSSQVSSPLSHECVRRAPEAVRERSQGRWAVGVNWERTDHPGEGSHTSWTCLDIVCFSRIPRTGKVNVDLQRKATACLPPVGPGLRTVPVLSFSDKTESAGS